MLKINHRVNTIEELKNVPLEDGIELDIRSEGEKLILHHEPFKIGENFEEFLQHYSHKFIILNTKCEGMEDEILNLMEKYKIDDYFFLDLSLPFLIKYSKKGIKKIAVRFSEYEPLEFVMKFKDMVDWVWIDCFSDLPLNKDNYTELKKYFNLCIVSPELQGYSTDRIKEFVKKLKGMKIDAVCTKRPDLWSN